jgi:hypothetical protein
VSKMVMIAVVYIKMAVLSNVMTFMSIIKADMSSMIVVMYVVMAVMDCATERRLTERRITKWRKT